MIYFPLKMQYICLLYAYGSSQLHLFICLFHVCFPLIMWHVITVVEQPVRLVIVSFEWELERTFNKMTFLEKMRAALDWALAGRFQEQCWITQPVVELFTFMKYRSFSGVSLYHSCTNLTEQVLLEIIRNIYLDLSFLDLDLFKFVYLFKLGYICCHLWYGLHI